VAQSECVRGSLGDVTVEQGRDEKDDSGDDGDPVQLAERSSDDIAGEVCVWQNLKSCRREDEGEED